MREGYNLIDCPFVRAQIRHVPVPPSVSVELKKRAASAARRAPPSSLQRDRTGVTEWLDEYSQRRSASLQEHWLPPWQRPSGLHGLSSSYYRQ